MNTSLETVKSALVDANHVFASNDEKVAEIHKIVNKYNVEGKRPFSIFDSVTGEKLGMSQKPVFEKRLASANGDLLALFASYKGRATKPKAEKPVKPAKAGKRTFEAPESEAPEANADAPADETPAADETVAVTDEGTVEAVETVVAE